MKQKDTAEHLCRHVALEVETFTNNALYEMQIQYL